MPEDPHCVYRVEGFGKIRPELKPASPNPVMPAAAAPTTSTSHSIHHDAIEKDIWLDARYI